MISILKYVLMTAMRDWLYVGVVISLLVAFGISVLIGSSAFSENNQFSIVVKIQNNTCSENLCRI